ncbi:MAG TPA: LPS assembly protein LptD, partial [Tepidisphaeraceae bacterium]|nr:LPS assembly protein LptD [Tepidisphaeraceae bacterium]
MRRRLFGIALLTLLLAATRAQAQVQPAVDYLHIDAIDARTWVQDSTQIMLLHGPVSIEMETFHLKAKSAVIWLTPTGAGVLPQLQAQIALIGDASVSENGVQRTGPNLAVNVIVRGDIRISAQNRLDQNASATPLYKTAHSLIAGTTQPPNMVTPPVTQPTPAPYRTLQVMHPAAFEFEHIQTVDTSEKKVAAVLSGGVLIVYRSENNESLEFQAQRAVVFTKLKSLGQIGAGERIHKIQDNVEAVYLEGDARITYTPQQGHGAEQRLLAERAYYDLTTDRAILTDVVLHTDDPSTKIPVTVRAETVRQLSHDEFETHHVMLSTSSFATPSLSLAATSAYVHQEPTDNADDQTLTYFNAHNAVVDAWGFPIFYLPYTSGTVSQGAIPLRQLQIGKSDYFGFHVKTTWGLYETLGETPPPNLDIAYHLDYYDTRGPATGVDAQYYGGYVSPTNKTAWDFQGDFKSYFIADTGIDQFGGNRQPVDSVEDFNKTIRGQFLWTHQYFLPDDWQVQVRAGWASDPNFLEEWDPTDFYRNDPHDLSLYVKHQNNSAAVTFLAEAQPNNFVTTSDMVPNQFEIQRLPEVTYHEIGDSLFNDKFTFFTSDSLSALSFSKSGATLAEQGYPAYLSPGLPSLGILGSAGPTDVPESTTYRGDFRQELDYPINAGEFKIVPYVVGRYTGYSDSITGSVQNRALIASGLRATTAFWAVDDTAESTLFDIHRLRHVIEPEINLFTSADNVDRGNLYIYDQNVDAINDISGGQLALRQTWQTKRGGPGEWH